MIANTPVFEPRIHDPYGLYPSPPHVSHTYETIDGYPPGARPYVEWLGRFNGENRVRIIGIMPDGTIVEPRHPPVMIYRGAKLFHGQENLFSPVVTSPIMTMDPRLDPHDPYYLDGDDPRDDIARYQITVPPHRHSETD